MFARIDRMLSTAAVLFLMPLCLLVLSAAQADEKQTSVRDGVYTAEQALRGEAIYSQHCQSCHAADMRGGPAARGLLGLGFQYVWKGKLLADLYAAMRDKMPPGNPGALSGQDYIDILAAILQRNEFPSGEVELTANADTLQSILIVWDSP